MKHYGKLDLRNMDCMELMAEYPDNHFDLAIVDPPYGIGIVNTKGYYNRAGQKNNVEHIRKDWDDEIPKKDYWNHLFRVSINQMVWGGNYMTQYLTPSRCWIFWDKLKYVPNYADGELCWTSFDQNTKKIQIQHHGFFTSDINSAIHPTQKPVALYRWLLHNYAKEGDKILDTHLGSGSIAIACYYMGFDLVGSELAADYYKAMIERVDKETKEQELF